MSTPITFHLDENVNHSVAAGPRRRGISVSTSSDTSLIGASDESQLAFASKNGRVFVTQDRDFLHPDFAHDNHAGIVFSEKDARTVGYLIRYLTLMHECLSADEMKGAVEFC